MPQTRYVLCKALARDLPAVVVINKVDRSDARSDEVVDEVYQLFFDLDAGEHHIEFPIVSTIAREGRAVAGIGIPAEDADLSALLDAIVETIPAPDGDPDAPLQAIVTNLDASRLPGTAGHRPGGAGHAASRRAGGAVPRQRGGAAHPAPADPAAWASADWSASRSRSASPATCS